MKQIDSFICSICITLLEITYPWTVIGKKLWWSLTSWRGFATGSIRWRLVLKQNMCFNNMSGHGPLLPALACLWAEQEGCWQDSGPEKLKCLPRNLPRWPGTCPPQAGLIPWLLSTQGGYFYLLPALLNDGNPAGAKAKLLLGFSCGCWTLRSVGSLPARTSCGRSGRYRTVWVTSHLLCSGRLQVSRHVPRLGQGTRAKSIWAAIATPSRGEWQGYSCPNP